METFKLLDWYFCQRVEHREGRLKVFGKIESNPPTLDAVATMSRGATQYRTRELQAVLELELPREALGKRIFDLRITDGGRRSRFHLPLSQMNLDGEHATLARYILTVAPMTFLPEDRESREFFVLITEGDRELARWPIRVRFNDIGVSGEPRLGE